jgi:hypothetical protein
MSNVRRAGRCLRELAWSEHHPVVNQRLAELRTLNSLNAPSGLMAEDPGLFQHPSAFWALAALESQWALRFRLFVRNR